MTGWRVPVDAWKGERCFILGGGPSLADVDVGALDGRIIAVNNAFTLRPDADLLYFSDRRWYDWNRDALDAYRGPLMVTRQAPRDPAHDVKVMTRNLRIALSRDPDEVAGYCGGANALNLAYLFGAREIILLGFDMRANGNWHEMHRTPQSAGAHQRFIPYFVRMAPELKREGVRVINATPGSALTCFPMADLPPLEREPGVGNTLDRRASLEHLV